jgi:hypothetical protein
MMHTVENDSGKGESSSGLTHPPLVPHPDWMRDTQPEATYVEADRTWRAGTSRLVGDLPPLEPSSITGGNTLKATAEVQHPYTVD